MPSFPAVATIALAVTTMVAAGLEERTHREGALPRRTLIGHAALSVVAIPVVAILVLPRVELAQDVRLGLTLCAAGAGGSSAVLLQRIGTKRATIGMLVVVMALISSLTAPLAYALVGLTPEAPLTAAITLIAVAGALQGVPYVAGRMVAAKASTTASRAIPWLARTNNVLFAATIIGFSMSEAGKSGDANGGARALGWSAVGAVLGMNVLCFGAGTVAARASRLSWTTAHAHGVRNLTIALLLASLTSAPGATTVTILFYGAVMFVIALVLAAISRFV